MQPHSIAAARYHLVNKVDISTNRAREKTETERRQSYNSSDENRSPCPRRNFRRRGCRVFAVRTGATRNLILMQVQSAAETSVVVDRENGDDRIAMSWRS